MTGVRLGRDAKFYLNTGTFASPTWSAVDQISDLTRGGTWDEIEASTRESVVKMGVAGMLDTAVTGKLKFVPGDTNQVLIADAFWARTTIDIMVLNGPNTTTGIRGVRFECQVMQNTEDQGLGTAVFGDLKFMPTPTTNSPCSVKVVAGAAVFTSL